MSMSAETVSQRIKTLQDGLKRAGVKLTHQRLEICREIATATTHPDAETVYRGVRERMPTVALDTVYRTLALLVELGLIDKLGAVHDSMRFDGNMSPHHHFVCTRCGATMDFYHDAYDQLPVPELVRALGNVQRVQVEVRGICQRCAQGDPS